MFLPYLYFPLFPIPTLLTHARSVVPAPLILRLPPQSRNTYNDVCNRAAAVDKEVEITSIKTALDIPVLGREFLVYCKLVLFKMFVKVLNWPSNHPAIIISI